MGDRGSTREALADVMMCLSALQDELLSTELLFRGLLSGLTPEEAVALMSALVFQVGGRPPGASSLSH